MCSEPDTFNVIYALDDEVLNLILTSPPGTMIIPTDFQYPAAVDAILVLNPVTAVGAGPHRKYLCIQAIFARSNTIGAVTSAALDVLVTALGGTNHVALCFLMPESTFKTFRRQNYGTASLYPFKMHLL